MRRSQYQLSYLSYTVQKILAKFQTLGLDKIKNTVKGFLRVINTNKLFQVYDIKVRENLVHIMIQCSRYKAQRTTCPTCLL